MHLLDSEVHIEVTHAEATLWEHGAVHESGPHLGAAFALPEARSTTAALFAAQDRGGYGRAGIDGCLFDAARGIGVAGDWLVETSVEAIPAPSPREPQRGALLSAGGLRAQGAFISGLALAGRVLEAHQAGTRAPASRVACSCRGIRMAAGGALRAWEGAGWQAVVPEDFAQNLGGDWGGTLGKKRHLTRYGGLGGISPSPPTASPPPPRVFSSPCSFSGGCGRSCACTGGRRRGRGGGRGGAGPRRGACAGVPLLERPPSHALCRARAARAGVRAARDGGRG